MSPNALIAMTSKDLRRLALSFGLPINHSMNKQQLILALQLAAVAPMEQSPSRFKDPHIASPSDLVAGSSDPLPQSVDPTPSTPDNTQQSSVPELLTQAPCGTSRLVLLALGPHRILAYWAVDPTPLGDIFRMIPSGHRPVLILMTPAGPEERDLELACGCLYLPADPNCAYEASLALRGSDGCLHHAITSNRIITPANSAVGTNAML